MCIKDTCLIFILKYTQNIDHIVQIFSLNYNGNRKRACRQLYVQEYSLHFPRAMPSVLPAIEIEISSNDRRSVLFFSFPALERTNIFHASFLPTARSLSRGKISSITTDAVAEWMRLCSSSRLSLR